MSIKQQAAEYEVRLTADEYARFLEDKERRDESERKRGDYWLTTEGRAELREAFPDKEDGNAVIPLLDALELIENYTGRWIG